MRWALGGGSGVAQGQAEGEGSGGGAGVMAAPAGFIEIADGAAEFRPIGHPIPTGFVIGAAIGFYLMMRGLRVLWR